MNKLECIFHIVTKSEANARDHWAVKAKRVKSQRSQSFLTCRVNFGIVLTSFLSKKIIVEMTRIASRTLDDDNLRSALKAVRDGIADYLQIDDGSAQISWIYKQQTLSKTNYVNVRLTISDE